MQRTFLRSATQATDSTLIGCTANSAATNRLGAVFPSRPHQQKEKQNYIHRVQQDAGEVVACGIQTKQRAIQSMGHPGQRMPVCLLRRCYSPANGFERESLSNMEIPGDVTIIVIIHERVTVNRVIDRDR